MTDMRGKPMIHTPLPGETIAVWFSCGAASAVTAKKTIEIYPSAEVRVINNPVAEEHEDNRRFLADCEAWLGVTIHRAVNSKYPNASCKDVWADRRFMSGVAGAPCTMELKKRAREQWEDRHRPDWHVLGFTVEEKKRAERFRLGERSNLLTPLIDLGMSKQDCIDLLLSHNIEPPLMYRLGYPNANCIGCVKASSPTYWNHVRSVHPNVFRERAKQSREIGCRLVRVKGVRIFLDELDPDVIGRPLKSMDFECGIFCEEKE